MLEPHLHEININNLQLEVSRKQTLNLSTHLAVFELLAYWLQNYLRVQCSSLLSVRSSVQIIAIKSIIEDSL